MNVAQEMEPTSLTELNWPSSQDRKYITAIANGQIQDRLLLWGPPGTGKSTTVRITAEHYVNTQGQIFTQIIKNSPSDTGVQFIERLENQIQLVGHYVIIYDELDHLSPQAMDRMKSLMDGATAETRFFFTTNRINEISQAIISRCNALEWVFPPQAIEAYTRMVVKKLRITATEADIQSIVARSGTDFRQVNRLLDYQRL